MKPGRDTPPGLGLGDNPPVTAAHPALQMAPPEPPPAKLSNGPSGTDTPSASSQAENPLTSSNPNHATQQQTGGAPSPDIDLALPPPTPLRKIPAPGTFFDGFDNCHILHPGSSPPPAGSQGTPVPSLDPSTRPSGPLNGEAHASRPGQPLVAGDPPDGNRRPSNPHDQASPQQKPGLESAQATSPAVQGTPAPSTSSPIPPSRTAASRPRAAPQFPTAPQPPRPDSQVNLAAPEFRPNLSLMDRIDLMQVAQAGYGTIEDIHPRFHPSFLEMRLALQWLASESASPGEPETAARRLKKERAQKLLLLLPLLIFGPTTRSGRQVLPDLSRRAVKFWAGNFEGLVHELVRLRQAATTRPPTIISHLKKPSGRTPTAAPRKPPSLPCADRCPGRPNTF